MFIDFLMERFRASPAHQAFVWQDTIYSYAQLLKNVAHWQQKLAEHEVATGAVVGLEGDFSPNAIGLLLALIEHACIIVPQNNTNNKLRDVKDDIAQIEYYFYVDTADNVRFERTGRQAEHEHFSEIRARKHPGIILFSSGTSGAPKAAVHDFTHLLEKFKTASKPMVTLNFLLFDHWGGLNTVLHTLASGGNTVTVHDRSPEVVCGLIEKYKVALLPATPTFLNLMIISGSYRQHNLSSLKLITYGAEPMPNGTLKRLHELFPNVKLLQTYGLIEVGVLRSKSKEDGSLWVKVGGDGCETRIVEGMLQIKNKSTILGYLNAPSPITEDGWFMTGDAVEVDGDYIKILGRKSEIINVGGEKVYPAEVESVIQEMDNVEEVTVYGEKNPLIGNIVCAKVKLAHTKPASEFTVELKQFCASRLESFKIPVRVVITEESHFGDRFKKARSNIAASGAQ